MKTAEKIRFIVLKELAQACLCDIRERNGDKGGGGVTSSENVKRENPSVWPSRCLREKTNPFSLVKNSCNSTHL